MENKAKESLGLSGEQNHVMEKEVKMHETAIETLDRILERSTRAQIMQPNEFSDKRIQREGEEEDTAVRGGESMATVTFGNFCL